MLISCKCLNFIASSNSQQHQPKLNSSATVSTADALLSSSLACPSIGATDEDCSMSSNCSLAAPSGSTSDLNSLSTALMQTFIQKYPRTFPFYTQCIEFFKQSIGPISDLAINAVVQRDLVYSITLEIKQPNNPSTSSNHCPSQAWQISICINCNAALCAKRLSCSYQSPDTAGDQQPQLLLQIQSQQQQYLINCSLLTNNDELIQRRSDKSFSETFGLLIIDNPQQKNDQLTQAQNSDRQVISGFNFATGSFSMGTGSAPTLDYKQQRLKQLQNNLQARLQKEIADTDERIQRYTEQQFALLKSFREKSDQEFQLLANQIYRVPDQCELLDKSPPSLEVNVNSLGMGAGSYAQRRRNTIGSRRDLISSQPATPTTLLPSSFLFTTQSQKAILNFPNSAIDGTIYPQQQKKGHALGSNNQNSVGGNGSFAVISQRKMSNFDTPPATPEATPMSVGNSPTFRQQQQQNNATYGGQLSTSNTFQQQFPTPTLEAADDCLFDLEDVENPNTVTQVVGGIHQQNLSAALSSYPQQIHRNRHEMSDVEESDSAEEAEDALGIENSVAIPMTNSRRGKSGMHDMLNFAKSLPIQIANSPLVEHAIANESDEDELDNTVDIAASIKALAKSVHGEAVFGDLPRPRLRSQI